MEGGGGPGGVCWVSCTCSCCWARRAAFCCPLDSGGMSALAWDSGSDPAGDGSSSGCGGPCARAWWNCAVCSWGDGAMSGVRELHGEDRDAEKG